MTHTKFVPLALTAAMVAGCANCGGTAEPATETPLRSDPPVEPVTYEVHEWGLVRGNAADQVMLSGPHAQAPQALVPMPMAKPVLYFHRVGDGPLTVSTSVTIPHGNIVEHWPPATPDGASISWPGVGVTSGHCQGSTYPARSQPPCDQLSDGCEAAELRNVETDDADCLQDAAGARWNHLFYRASVTEPPPLPLTIETLPGGRLRVTHRGEQALAGDLLRLRHPGGNAPADAALVVSPPSPGQSIELDAPAGPVAAAADALSQTLQTAGLTEPEARAFRRAWDGALFALETTRAAGESVTATITTEAPMASPARPPWTSLVYVLPESTADAMATLSFEPAPRAVRRVIVAWIDEANPPN